MHYTLHTPNRWPWLRERAGALQKIFEISKLLKSFTCHCCQTVELKRKQLSSCWLGGQLTLGTKLFTLLFLSRLNTYHVPHQTSTNRMATLVHSTRPICLWLCFPLSSSNSREQSICRFFSNIYLFVQLLFSCQRGAQHTYIQIKRDEVQCAVTALDNNSVTMFTNSLSVLFFHTLGCCFCKHVIMVSDVHSGNFQSIFLIFLNIMHFAL